MIIYPVGGKNSAPACLPLNRCELGNLRMFGWIKFYTSQQKKEDRGIFLLLMME